MAAHKKTTASTSIQEWTARGIAKVEESRKRGRPVTTGTTPAKDRKAKERATQAQAGGQRLNINLTPQAAEDLAAIQSGSPTLTRTEAVHYALRAMAGQFRRR